MLRAGPYRAAIVIGAEVMSRVLDMKDRSTCVLFGDGAGAVVLKASSDPGILAARMYADGDYGEKVLSLTASLNHGAISGDPYIRMDGRQVFRLAVEGLVGSAREVADLACVHTEDVALFVPHQANLRIMTMVAAKLGIPEERMVRTVAEHGNTSAASVPACARPRCARGHGEARRARPASGRRRRHGLGIGAHPLVSGSRKPENPANTGGEFLFSVDAPPAKLLPIQINP